MRKLGSALLIILFVFMSIICFPVYRITGVQEIQVTVKPRRISTKAAYIIIMKLEKILEVHDWIKVIFPKEAKLPVLPEDPLERTEELKRIIESIYIGTSPCSACQGLPELNYRENSIKFNIHMELNPTIPGYEKVTITITDRVGVVNPPEEDFYKIKISTAKEIEAFSSEPFEIVKSQIGDPTGIPVITPNPAGFFQNSTYEVRFRVGRGGEMSFNQSRIRIRFPLEIQFAYSIDKIPLYAITVNGKPNNNKFALSGQVITFITPVDVENSAEVVIKFEKEVGIVNPAKPGTYYIEVSSSEDPLWIKSAPFIIENQGTSLRIEPNKTHQKADIQFIATLQYNIDEMNPLLVEFPDTFFIPTNISNNTVLINQNPSKVISVHDHMLIIYPHEITNKLTPMSVHILKDAEIRNPKEKTKVRLYYKSSLEKDFLFTDEISIEPATFEIDSLVIDPPNASSKAQYKFTFFIESEDGLSKRDTLWIQFPEGILIPSQIEPSLVLFYGINPEKIQVHSFNMIEIQLPYPVRTEEYLVLQIDKSVGITNPPNHNDKLAFITWFNKFPEEKKTVLFQFSPPVPKTTISFSEGVIGLNNWYIQPPVLHLSADQKDVDIYLFWDDEAKKAIQYTQPEKLMPGQYKSKLSFYAIGPYGTEDTQSVIIQVDTIFPSFKLHYPLDPDTNKTNKKELIWQGEIKQETTKDFYETINSTPSSIQLNGSPFPVDEKGKFSIISENLSGENLFVFLVEDPAGNKTIEKKTIFAKFSLPELLIISPIMNSYTTKKDIIIVGKTDPFSTVIFNKSFKINTKDGNFSFPYPLYHFGKQVCEFSSTDDYGNTKAISYSFWFGISILLTINQNRVLVNEHEEVLLLTPFIQSGRTFVPFRFLGEQLGAEVQYTIEPKTKLVNTISYELEDKRIILFLQKRTIQVNEKIYPLNPMPIIRKGTTFIPVRLVSEYMSCKVFWDKALQQVLIEYPDWEKIS